MRENNFTNLNLSLGKFFSLNPNDNFNSFLSSSNGLKIQIFIAFSYTYHYLNWFSKISLIGWLKESSKKRIFSLIILWLLSLGLYFYNYQLGLTVFFFLSLLHVTLEFPLNIRSISEIFKFKNKLNVKKS